MKTPFTAATLFIASAMLVGSPAFAQVTREQVKAELAAAIVSGDIISADSGLKLNELYPSQYPARQVRSTVTREQVLAELAAAQRNGDIVVGEDGRTLAEMNPGGYPAKQAQSTVTRAQVQAELFAALRTGDYPAPGEESGLCKDVHPSMHAAN